MIILLDQKEYAVGLSWFAISSVSEAEQFQRELDLNFGLIKISKTEQSTIALCSPEYNGQVSLAGMLALAYENLIYVTATNYKDESGQPFYYLCAVKNHAVTVDGDVLGSREAIVAQYAQNFADITADIDPTTVNIFATNVDDELFPGATLVDFNQVIDVAARFADQATIKALGKKELSKISLMAVVVLFSGLCFGVYEYFFNQPPPPPPPVKTAAPVPVAPKKDPYQEFINQFAQTLQNQARPQSILSTVAQLRKMPINYGGWAVVSANFSESSPDTLNLNLKREPYATLQDIQQVQAAGRLMSLNLDFAGDLARATLPISTENRQVIALEDIKNLEREGSPNYFTLLNLMQQNKAFNFKVKDEKTDNPYFAQNGLTFTGSGLWSMEALVAALSPFTTLGIDSISVNIENGNYNWTIEGVIYG